MYKHYVCLFICNIAVFLSHSTTISGNWHMTGLFSDLAMCMPEPTQIIIFCDPWYRKIVEFDWLFD